MQGSPTKLCGALLPVDGNELGGVYRQEGGLGPGREADFGVDVEQTLKTAG